MLFMLLAVPIATKKGVATLQGLEGVFQNTISVALGFGGIVLFVMLVAGGLQYITAAGDPKAVDQAQKTLTYAIFGMVFLALSYLVLVLIKNFTGVDVTQFRVVQP